MNIWLDDAIYRLQSQGGISRLWNELTPRLKARLPEATWDTDAKPDLFISTYYRRAPIGVRSVAVLYDCIHERLPAIGATHPDAVAKRIAVKEAAAVVAISETTARDCERYFGKRAVVAYCGGAERFERATPAQVNDFQRRYGILKPYILLVGRRDGYKYARGLYEAWPYFAAAQDHLVVAVGGEHRTAADDDFMRRFPHSWVRVSIGDGDLKAAYSGATALAYPSLYEGFGLPLVEAMGCGCPVVLGRDGAGAEVAGDAGFYGEPLIPRSYAAALNAALDPSERLTHAMTGYERARLFSWDAMADRMAEVIRSVV